MTSGSETGSSAIRRVAFFGSPAFALPVLEALHGAFEVVLVVSQPDKPVGRGLKLTPPPVAARAAELGLKLAQPRKLRGNAEFEAELRASGAEVAVTCAYGKLLPQSLLDALPYGFLNTHTSLLPKWRGAAPIQWALIEGESVTGTTIMQTDAGMDTGPVLRQEELTVAPEWTALELSAALSQQAARLAVQTVRERPGLTPQPQDHGQATHAPLLTKEDGFVRWQEPAQAIVNRYRGVAAWPQTTAFLGGTRLKLDGLSAVPAGSGQPGTGQPGTVLGTDGDALLVAAAEGAVRIQTVQPASKKPQPAARWAASQGLGAGSQFDLWAPTSQKMAPQKSAPQELAGP
ncbi:methionyl-tRNA formyltransferase [Deinococcus piscis]|uniref:Methionyl-tRNA formyltransferase n=1 Tax=Deinococcus piscis TaxID=394230 RepID=A0ABQ3JZU5_9DEIO|nr:methionyl-tRNA formyltransferase [Deinococcus piscis]GHF93204.1 methionyl-tRNA formyltransferase [Deinococcus piscis]